MGVGVLVSPEHLRDVIRPLASAAAEAAGRDPGAVRFPMAAMVSVDHDEERARATTRHAICRLFHPVPHPYYDFLLRAQGFAETADAAAELVPQGRIREAMDPHRRRDHRPPDDHRHRRPPAPSGWRRTTGSPTR